MQEKGPEHFGEIDKNRTPDEVKNRALERLEIEGLLESKKAERETLLSKHPEEGNEVAHENELQNLDSEIQGLEHKLKTLE